MVKWRAGSYGGSKDSEKIGSTKIRSRGTNWQWVGNDACICSSVEFCCYSSENRTWKTYRILQSVLLTWTAILRNGVRNQRLNSLFPGRRTALQSLPLQQEQMARSKTPEFTMFLGSTSREAKQSAFLFQTVATLLKQTSSSFTVFHFILKLVVHCTHWMPSGWNQNI